MSAWQVVDFSGTKLVTVVLDNHLYRFPPIQGTYLFFDVKTGTLKASTVVPSLTEKKQLRH
ncbi:MAG: ornithine cyclodeaminase/alanine dehydrogenase-like protein (mu-crystallin family) [Colwellia sp.]|jgi:ornithine cyclodeaminase/alanine dehydrogenase-like protein (mu-crystallin family)